LSSHVGGGGNPRKIVKLRRKRSFLDIMADILNVAQKGASKTRLVYGCNLNFTIIKDYIDALLELGLLKYDGNGAFFTTVKGKDYLQSYRRLRSLTSRFSEDSF
jgi:predicted transcriptional regulator